MNNALFYTRFFVSYSLDVHSAEAKWNCFCVSISAVLWFCLKVNSSKIVIITFYFCSLGATVYIQWPSCCHKLLLTMPLPLTRADYEFMCTNVLLKHTKMWSIHWFTGAFVHLFTFLQWHVVDDLYSLIYNFVPCPTTPMRYSLYYHPVHVSVCFVKLNHKYNIDLSLFHWTWDDPLLVYVHTPCFCVYSPPVSFLVCYYSSESEVFIVSDLKPVECILILRLRARLVCHWIHV